MLSSFVYYKKALALVIVLMVSLYPLSAICQYDEGNFARYTKEQGLSHNYISGITQDMMGYLWISTHKGLNRFDGTAFRNYYKSDKAIPLPDNFIESISINKGTELLLSTYTGLLALNTKSFYEKKLLVPSDSSICFWTNHFVNANKDTLGNYIVSGKTGLYVFNKKGIIINRYDFYFPADAGKKELWFGGWLQKQKNGDVWNYNEKSIFCYKPFTNQLLDLCENNPWLKNIYSKVYKRYTMLMPGGDGQLLFFDTKNNSFNMADVARQRIETISTGFTVEEEIDDNSSIIALNDTTMAVTGKASGFYILQKNKVTEKYKFMPQKFWSGKFCTLLFKDQDGRLWIGTSDGLFKQNLYGSFFQSHDLSKLFKDIANQPIRAILVKGDKIFAGFKNGGGIVVLNKTTLQPDKKFQWKIVDIDSRSINILYNYSKDTIWAGTQKGLFWINTQNYHYGKIKMDSSLAWTDNYSQQCVYRDSRGRVWIPYSKLNGLIWYDPTQRKFDQLNLQKNPLFKITFCRSIVDDRLGNIWFSGDGLCRWNYKKQLIDTLVQYAVISSTIRNHMLIQDIDSNHKIWISGFDNELLTYDCKSNVMEIRKGQDKFMNGNNTINSPIINNYLWLATDNGITAFNIKNASIKQFNYADGLPSVAISTVRSGWSFDSTDNYFYIGAKQYLIKFRPDIKLSYRHSPKLLLENAEANKQKKVFENGLLQLKYFENNITIHFSAINFIDPEDNRFAYKIEETDTTWQDIEEKNSISFLNLPAGSYHFKLKLFSANNRWQPVYSGSYFVIHPPFWRAAWFITASVLLLAALSWLIFKQRTKNIRAKANLNNQLASLELKALHAQMNPHFIFNALNSIKDMILMDEKINASRYLSKFAQLIRLNLEHSSHASITLHQNIDYLHGYLAMEKLRFTDFTYSIETINIENDYEIKIPPMLIQPIVENAIWHGLLPKEGAKKVSIRFSCHHQHLYCHIDDNGIGLLQSQKNKSAMQAQHRSVGLQNIQDRIDAMNKKYILQSKFEIMDKSTLAESSGSGTIAILTLPLEMYISNKIKNELW